MVAHRGRTVLPADNPLSPVVRQQSRHTNFRPSAYREWKGWGDEKFGAYDPVQSVSFRCELADSGVPLSQPLSILEIGFGNGAFAGWVLDQGWGFVGTELDPELVERGRRRGLEVYKSDAGLTDIAAGRKFDAIIAFDVLEHLDFDDIVDLLNAARQCLVPGGRLIARVPSGDSPFSRAIQHGDTTHRTTLGSGVVRQLAAESGCRVVQIRAPVFPLRGVGTVRALRRSGILALRALIKAVVNLAFHDNQPRVVEPNMVIVLRASRIRVTRSHCCQIGQDFWVTEGRICFRTVCNARTKEP